MKKYVEYLIGEDKDGLVVPKDNIIKSIELNVENDKGEDKDYLAEMISNETGIPVRKVLVGTVY